MNQELDHAIIDRVLLAVKQQSPLIHNITNLVVMNTSANMLLAMGASPLMAHAVEEMDDIVSLSHALVLNMGTLDATWVNAMQRAQAQALKLKKPIVFDPVGAGASSYRTQTAKAIVQAGVTVLRGNASEIMSLCDERIISKGVDSSCGSEQALQAARHLSNHYQCCVVISGETDYIVAQDALYKVEGGDALLTQVTGMGCSATAMIAACCAVESSASIAATSAMTLMAQAAEEAVLLSAGPGSFYPALLDAVANNVTVPAYV